MLRHLEPQRSPPAVVQDRKREQSLKGQGRNYIQINGGDRLRVVSQECLPALRRVPSCTMYFETVDWATAWIRDAPYLGFSLLTPRDMRGMRLDECRDGLRIGCNLPFALDPSYPIDDADRCQLHLAGVNDVLVS
jgi:hypothetical protein